MDGASNIWDKHKSLITRITQVEILMTQKIYILPFSIREKKGKYRLKQKSGDYLKSQEKCISQQHKFHIDEIWV